MGKQRVSMVESEGRNGSDFDLNLKKDLGEKKYDTNTSSRGRSKNYKNKDKKKPRWMSPGYTTFNPSSQRVSRFDVSDVNNQIARERINTSLTDCSEFDFNRTYDIQVESSIEKDVTHCCTVKARKSNVKVQSVPKYLDDVEADIDNHFFGGDCWSDNMSDGQESDSQDYLGFTTSSSVVSNGQTYTATVDDVLNFALTGVAPTSLTNQGVTSSITSYTGNDVENMLLTPTGSATGKDIWATGAFVDVEGLKKDVSSPMSDNEGSFVFCADEEPASSKRNSSQENDVLNMSSAMSDLDDIDYAVC